MTKKKPLSYKDEAIQLPTRRFSLFIFLFLLIITVKTSFWEEAAAQQRPAFLSYPHNHLDWYTIESDRFLVHFQEGNDRPARVISRISEEIWDDITSLYDYEPDTPISIVLIDREDYSNGAAYFFDNKIEIWLPSLDTPFRGTNNWLRDVIAHEFTHLVQIQASMSGKRSRPITYVQWLSYENVRRPDVLYGYPSGIISYPFSTVSMPAWFAEGTAQFMRDDLHYDYWDTHRDMMLRTRILDGKELGLVEMGHFQSKNSMERELSYNQGFAFTQYLSNRFGEQVIADITHGLKTTNDIRTSMRRVTGIPGEQLYREWTDSLRTEYRAYAANINPFEAKKVYDLGFINVHPSFTPDGKIAFLSNTFFDFARTQLIVLDEDGTKRELLDTGNAEQSAGAGSFRHSCGMFSTPLISRIGSGFSFSPDGKTIAYNFIRQNRYGETYNDIYLYDTDSGDTRKLTRDARLSEPSWSPDGSTLAALQTKDGTINLVLVDPETGDIKPLSSFNRSEQLFRPAWSPDGSRIYAAMGAQKGRNIVVFNPDEPDKWDILLMNPELDMRDPFVSPDGKFLYLSVDRNHKFDIYRYNLKEGGNLEQLTDVVGGAFMPHISENGDLLYSEFTSMGYKIRKAPVDSLLAHAAANQLAVRPAFGPPLRPDMTTNPLNTFDDMDIEPFDDDIYRIARSEPYSFDLRTRGANQERLFYSYEDTFLNFSFLPAVRFDNYSQEFGRNSSLIRAGNFGDLGRNIIRDTKLGFYMSSREVLERFSIFGGLLVGPASREADTINNFFSPGRLIDLDRDLFFIAEYTGLPFIERHWSPTIEVAFYNLRRNVRDGIDIEEFACTACLPDTTSIDIAYDIWQAEINLYSKINRYSLVQLGWHHSPYRVSTASFFSNEFEQFVPGSTARYFIGNTLTAAYVVDAYLPYRHGDIAPLGFRGHIRYSYEPSRLLDSYEIRDGTLIPVYNTFRNHSVELDARYGFMGPFFRVFQARARLFSYFDNPDEYFFLDYIGGFDGMRSYPFFALGGNRTAFGQVSFYQPLFTNINRQSGRFTLDKVFARFFAETGNGWGGPLDIGDNLKTGIGAELRIAVNSYYLFPSRFFISGAYGLNQFNLRIPDGFVSADQRENVTFGGEVLINFGLLFDFEL
ncbi:MAG: hypothetical protein LAT67_03445 [Balneolales bacterium]|nr:hypothetical protein [Balneolales bacterium]